MRAMVRVQRLVKAFHDKIMYGHMGMAVFCGTGRKAILMWQKGGGSLVFGIGIWYWIPLWNYFSIFLLHINLSL